MKPKSAYTPEEAKNMMERYCSQRERCHKEVITKLQRMKMVEDDIEVVVANLIEGNFLNETRFAKSFAHDKSHIQFWGPLRIIQELRQKDVSQYDIETALKAIENDCQDIFDVVFNKLERTTTGKNIYIKREKITRKLLYRGWEHDRIREKLEENNGLENR